MVMDDKGKNQRNKPLEEELDNKIRIEIKKREISRKLRGESR